MASAVQPQTGVYGIGRPEGAHPFGHGRFAAMWSTQISQLESVVGDQTGRVELRVVLGDLLGHCLALREGPAESLSCACVLDALLERFEGGSDATQRDHGPVEVEGDHRLPEAAPELTEQMVAWYRGRSECGCRDRAQLDELIHVEVAA
jgi:hypothetical protein